MRKGFQRMDWTKTQTECRQRDAGGTEKDLDEIKESVETTGDLMIETDGLVRQG
jgi:hypothetical protein